MIPLIYIAGASIAALLVDAKVTPLGLGKINPIPRTLKPSAPAKLPPPTVTPGGFPGTGTVDGHGTGSLPPDINPNLAAQIVAAAIQAANNQTANQNVNPVTSSNQAAEDMKNKIIGALNTPAGDRSPEQLALLSSLSSLPVIGT